MRKTILLSAVAMGLAFSPAAVFAQAGPNAASGTVTPQNSLPSGSPPSTQPPGAGGNLGTTSTGAGSAATAQPGVNTLHPLHSLRRAATHPRPRRHTTPSTSSDASPGVGATTADGARPGNLPGTGNSLPTSTQASNITAADTRSDIAPRLPTPNATSNSPAGYLQAAKRAIAGRRTGTAQEALERAETRALDRSVDPSAANTPDSSSLVAQIGEARRALASGNMSAANSAIDGALSAAR